VGVFERFLRVAWQLLLHLKDYDSIGCHVSKRGFSVFAPLAIILGRLFNKKVLVRKFGGELENTYKNSKLLNKLFIKFVMKADVILLETKSQVKYFSKEFPNSNIMWYPNSRPSSNNVKMKRKFNNKIIFIGHVKQSKGILDLVEAVKGLDIQLDIYGPLEDVSEKQLTLPNVNYKGVVDNGSVAEIISGYSVLVLPTYYEGEGYPGVIIESYSVGVPVISTNWRCIPELVDNRVSGILVKIKQPLALSEALLEVSNDEDLYNNLCVGALFKFSDFDSHVLTQKYISVL